MIGLAPGTSKERILKGNPTSSRPVSRYEHKHSRPGVIKTGDAASHEVALCLRCAWSDLKFDCSVDHIMAHLPLHHGWAFPHPRGQQAL